MPRRHLKKIIHHVLKPRPVKGGVWGGFIALILVFFFVLIISLFSYKSNNFHRSSPLSGWDYQAFNPSTDITVSTKSTPKTGVIDFKYHNSSVEFQIPLTNSQLKQAGQNKMTFDTSTVQVQYQTITNGLKENIILHQIPTTNQFQSQLKVTNADVYLNTEGLPVFLDPKTKKYLFHVQKPYAFDAKGNRTDAVFYTLQCNGGPACPPPSKSKSLPLLDKLTKLGNSTTYTLILKVDSKWLFDPQRAYPITVDPTIIVAIDTQTKFSSGAYNRIRDTGASDLAPVLETYYQELSADQNTVALWHLNETVGTTLADASGLGNTLALGPGSSAPTIGVPSPLNVGASFNGTTTFLRVGSSNTSVTGSELTLEMWINPIFSVGITTTPFHKDSQYSLAIDPNGYIAWADSSNFSYASFGYQNIGLASNVWQHLAITKSGGVVSLYLNGTLKLAKPFGGNITGTTAPTVIGCYGTFTGCVNTYIFKGSLDEIRISNIARSAEQIRADAGRRPYGVYTSPVVDMVGYSGLSSQWNAMTWDESGVATGNGETLFNSTNLVAQWNFNNNNFGTTGVSVDAGSCGVGCTGMLINFAGLGTTEYLNVASTSSPSGYTLINRRWGTGALQFDGVDDYVTFGNPASLQIIGNVTYEAWINTSSQVAAAQGIISKMIVAGPSYSMALRTNNGNAEFGISSTGSNWLAVYSPIKVNDGKWHYLVGTYTPSTSIKIYVDGILQATNSTAIPASAFNNAASVTAGMTYSTLVEPFKGIIDSARIYSRALTAAEILSNYNAGNVEFQTRTGNTSNANDGSWEDWKPGLGTTEVSIDSMDDYNVPTCVGGTPVSDGRVFLFTGVGTTSFACTSNVNVEVLVVAGGGGGGTNMGGGGGGGGVLYQQFYPLTANSPVSVSVGIGGSGAPAGVDGSHPSVPGTNGDNSTFGTLTAIGGGAGGLSPNTMGNANGVAGGSGGGASGYNNDAVAAGTHTGGAGTSGQGYRGGNQGNAYYSGGGGGAGGPGADGNNKASGGIGFYSNILGTGYYWGGGGGGAGYNITGGDGGLGGGGGGGAGITFGGPGFNNGNPGGGGCIGCQANVPGGDGGANTGGGGGGGSHYWSTNKGGDGGSGIVIVKVSPLSFTKDTTLKMEGVGSQKVTISSPVNDQNTTSIWHLDETGNTITSTTTIPFATGGVITYVNGYTLHTFYSSGNFTVNGSGYADVLIVGGGGGGGSDMGGGGGGGGVIYKQNYAFTPAVLSVTVGNGGPGAPTGVGQVAGTNGGSSSFLGFTALGGGGGGSEYNTAAAPAHNGSSGGGSAGCNNGASGSGTPGQGYDGGSVGGCYYPSGGGGAGGPGFTNPANGGIGVSNSITGTTLYWGAGGAGAGYSNISGNGGIGGGGGGAPLVSGGGYGDTYGNSIGCAQNGGVGVLVSQTNQPGGGAAAGSGAGGGGGSYNNINNYGGAGAAGIVIIRYPTSYSPVTVTNTGTATGTTVVQGISGKARYFNGSTDYIDTNITSSSTTMTIEAWIKPTTNVSLLGIAGKRSGTANTWGFYSLATGKLDFTLNGTADYTVGTTNVTPYVWQHVAATVNGTALNIYYNGANIYSATMAATIANDATTFKIGQAGNGTPFAGSIDEVRISNTARSAEEIANDYRLGANLYATRTISTTDLSSKSSLPFYIAADKPGQYLSLSIGNNAFANYQPDVNTVGFWHLDEPTSSGAYIKDSAGTNHGTPTGTTFTQGQIGKARYFNGTSDVVDLGNPSSLALSGNTISFGAWINATSFTGYPAIISRGSNPDLGAGKVPYFMFTNNIGQFGAGVSNASGSNTVSVLTTAGLSTNTWYYVVCTYDGTNIKIYLNGILANSAAQTGNLYTTATGVHIGHDVRYASGTRNFNGIIDEVRIDNVARSADDIRAAYEIGLRTHPITIDFAANLNSGNLITSSSDLSFTIDATTRGLSQMGSNLYVGDKIIVRENVGGTEYIAQGLVNSINTSTGAVTVSSWDNTSTFPSGGFSANADTFKWQRESFPINNRTIPSQINGITQLSLRLTDGNENRTVWLDDLKSNSGYLTNNLGSTLTSTLGPRYLQYRFIENSSDTAVSPAINKVTLNYLSNAFPDVPTLSTPANGSVGVSLFPTFTTSGTDVNSDYLRFKLTLCTNPQMTINCQVVNQSIGDTGWFGQNTDGGFSYTPGATATYYSTLLTPGTTYYWKTQAIDPAGSNTWGPTQTTPFSFTTTYQQPTLNTCEILYTPVSVGTSLRPIWQLNTTGFSSIMLQRKRDDDVDFFDDSHNPLSVGVTGQIDTSISLNHTYQYRVAPVYPNGTYGSWCTTSVIHLYSPPTSPTPLPTSLPYPDRPALML